MKRFLLSLTIILSITSCSTPRPIGNTEAEVLFKEAQELVKENRFLIATERLNLLRSKYPYSYFATHAELLQADVLFSQENYEESANAYILFKDFHPKNKRLDYVTFRIAESFYNQIPDTYDRDLGPAFEAIKYYRELTNFYPNSKLVQGSEEKIKKSEAMIYKKEQYIADFYYKTEVYDSARFRYLGIVEKFSEIKDIKEHAMKRVILSSVKLKEYDQCRKYYDRYYSLFEEGDRKSLDKKTKKCLKK